ncbi:MAG: hypothetical protein CMN71_04970 [Sphingomonadaceae bacterium]|jgi:uncharacterized protein YdcH (DUF465 family)|uniref:DUF465 domain-containing protein n=2 Tax=Erythrobacter/Porphyrobacter group TaxID=2800788 RepID=A0A345YCR9_9SPHN|nr:DUF465 domain-containing protein [Erythrobacter aureus]MBL44077.1 hypothetical protein [Sphingomonadaceae bacterium]MBQ96113.1 hypothetical protein [Actinomycetota bacterium]|tara:strand:+ start:460 stop:681 length:222 start_codon:yes stop_codon:yes gene_type:complete
MESSMTRKSPDEKIMIPYLRKLTREHRQLNRLIDTTKSAIARDELKALKRLRLRLKDKIVALQRHYYGRGLTG